MKPGHFAYRGGDGGDDGTDEDAQRRAKGLAVEVPPQDAQEAHGVAQCDQEDGERGEDQGQHHDAAARQAVLLWGRAEVTG